MRPELSGSTKYPPAGSDPTWSALPHVGADRVGALPQVLVERLLVRAVRLDVAGAGLVDLLVSDEREEPCGGARFVRVRFLSAGVQRAALVSIALI
jgi:hypothetical protein